MNRKVEVSGSTNQLSVWVRMRWLQARLNAITARWRLLRRMGGRSSRSRGHMQRLLQAAAAASLAASLLLTPMTPARAAGAAFTQQTGSANPFDGLDMGSFRALSFVDVDGDGDMDAFVGDASGVIFSFENTGTSLAPVFTEQTGSANPFDGVDVGFNSKPSFVDVDGDGDLDAFVGEKDGTINFFENTGTPLAPVFSEQTGTANPFDGVDVGDQSTPSFVDVDGDGDLDAFVGEDDGVINFFENTGSSLSPLFTAQTGSANPFNGVDVGDQSAPSFVDVDGDGDMDAFVGNLDGTINFFENTGTPLAPVFTAQIGSANPFDGVDVGNNSTPSFVDGDGDGDMDAFVGETDATINFFRNTGSNTVDPDYRELTGAANPFDGVDVGGASTPTFADIDGDGDLDAFVGEYEGNINFFRNTGTSLSPAFSEQTGSNNPFDGVNADIYSTPTFADIDGDGDLDVFVGAFAGVIHYFRNTGTPLAPVFSQQTGSANPLDGVDVGFGSTPTFADIDADGDLDAFVGAYDGVINYFRNIGTPLAPLFSEGTGEGNPFNGVNVGNYSTPTFADVDADGDLDAFVGEGDGVIHFFRNTGTAKAPVFTEQTGSANPLDSVNLGVILIPTFADIDGDGDLDAFIGEYGGRVYLFENTHCSFSSENSGSLAAGSVFHFGNGESRVTVKVNSVGDPALTSISASCTAGSHPNAIGQLSEKVFWTLTPNSGAGGTTPFSLDLEFPFKSPDANDRICRYTGSAWDCAQTSFTGNSIIRSGVTELSDWTTTGQAAPTAVDVMDFSAATAWGSGPQLSWATGSETGLSGFHIWRGNADAAQTRLTDALIGATGGLNGGEYTWQDSVAFGWGERVWYWLEAVHADGSSRFTGPVEVWGLGKLFLPAIGR